MPRSGIEHTTSRLHSFIMVNVSHALNHSAMNEHQTRQISTYFALPKSNLSNFGHRKRIRHFCPIGYRSKHGRARTSFSKWKKEEQHPTIEITAACLWWQLIWTALDWRLCVKWCYGEKQIIWWFLHANLTLSVCIILPTVRSMWQTNFVIERRPRWVQMRNTFAQLGNWPIVHQVWGAEWDGEWFFNCWLFN